MDDRRYRLLAIGLLCVALTPAQAFSEAEVGEAGAAAYTLTIYHTNDLHGRSNLYPQLVSTLNELRETRGEGLLLDAGDVFSGTLYFTEFRGRDAVEFMNLMGYDAFAPGNHEFDLGDPERGHPELVSFLQAADFPILAANVDFSAEVGFDGMQRREIAEAPGGGGIYDGIVLEHAGERIGIFGLTTEDTRQISSPGAVRFEDYLERAREMVARFEAQGVDKIVALTHLGYDSDPSVGNDLLLARQVEGIDIIVGGHSHTRVEPPTLVTENLDGEAMAPTVIGQAGEYGQYVGVMHVAFDAGGVVIEASGELVAVEEREPDAEAARLLEPYTAAIEALRDERIGVRVANALPNPRHGAGDATSVRAGETGLGNLIADAQLAAARRVEPATVMAVQNSGGIREPLAAGEVSVGDLIVVQPFGNRLTLLELSGGELLEMFEASVESVPDESGGFLQVSSGVRLVYDSRRDPGERVVSLEIEVDGRLEEVEAGATYVIATNSFTATGGDGHAALAAAYEGGRGTIVGATDWEMLRDFLEARGEVAYDVEGRLVDLAVQAP